MRLINRHPDTLMTTATTDPVNTVMLIAGAVFFVVLAALLVILVVGKRKFAPLLPFFVLPVVMIGFPHITHVKVAGAEIDTSAIEEFKKDPNNPAAALAFHGAVAKLEYAAKANPDSQMSAATKSNLEATVKTVSTRTDLTPESRLALANAQLFLNQTNAAAATLNAAVKQTPKIKTALAPRLQHLVK